MSAFPSPSAAPGFRASHRLRALADLAEAQGAGLGPEITALIDAAAAALLRRCSTAGRSAFAERAATLAVRLPETLALLGGDVITVARPVLASSAHLDDQDLIASALAGGVSHRVAIAGRDRLSSAVTDILVASADLPVLRAVSANPGAHLSRVAEAELVRHAATDAALREALGRRDDLSALPRRRLEVMRGADAQTPSRPAFAEPPTVPAGGEALSEPAPGFGGTRRDYGPPLAGLRAATRGRPITEADVVALAGAGRTEHALCAAAALAELPVATIEAMFDARSGDMLVALAEAKGWTAAGVALRQLRRSLDEEGLEGGDLSAAAHRVAPFTARQAAAVNPPCGAV